MEVNMGENSKKFENTYRLYITYYYYHHNVSTEVNQSAVIVGKSSSLLKGIYLEISPGCSVTWSDISYLANTWVSPAGIQLNWATKTTG